MKTLAFLSPLFLLLAAHAAPQQELSPELNHLRGYADEEHSLIDATRKFDLDVRKFMETTQEKIKQLVDQGDEEAAEAKFEEMKRRVGLVDEAWQFVTNRYSYSPRAAVFYGEFLYDIRGYQESGVRFWKMALTFDERMSSAHNNLGLHYMHSGFYDQGLTHLGKSLDIEPENPDYLYNMVQIYMVYFPQIEKRYAKMSKKKIYKEAMRLSRKAARNANDDYEINMDYALNFYLAEKFDVEPDWEDAAEAWAHARTLADGDQAVFYTTLNEGRTCIRAKRWDTAVQRLEEASKMEPDSQVVRDLLSQARAQKSR